MKHTTHSKEKEIKTFRQEVQMQWNILSTHVVLSQSAQMLTAAALTLCSRIKILKNSEKHSEEKKN